MRRLILGTLATLALGGLTGCSDDEEPQTSAEPSGMSTSQMAALQPGECKLDVTISGDAEAEFSSKGEFNGSINESQPSIYRFFPGKDQVVVYAAGGDIKEAMTFSLDGSNYSTSGGELDVDPDGGGATIDAQAQSTDGKVVDVAGDVTCADSGEKSDQDSGGSQSGKRKSDKKSGKN